MPPAEDAVRQDQVGARKQNHVDPRPRLLRIIRLRRCATGALRPSSGSARAPAARNRRAIDLAHQLAQPALVGRREHDHAGALGRRKAAIVEVVAIERDERRAELTRQAVVHQVGGAADVVVLEHEEHIPAEHAGA